LFNPFNRELFGSVIHSFERSLAEDPRDAYVIYMNPVNDDLFVDSPAFEPLDRGPWHSVHVARRGE